MFKSILFALLIVALLLLAAAPVQADQASQTCIQTTYIVGRVYFANGTSRVQTLLDVARVHNTSAWRIRSLNPGTVLSPLIVGQQLNVWDCDAPLADPTPRPTPRPSSSYRCMITAAGQLVCPPRTR